MKALLVIVILVLSSSCNKKSPSPPPPQPVPTNVMPTFFGVTGSEEWAYVPENAGGMGLSGFFVMKYEARAWRDVNLDSTLQISEIDSDGFSVNEAQNIPVSVSNHLPWRIITANSSAAECESLGPQFHLLSNIERIAIARDIESVSTNWTGQSIGSGCLYRGNSGEAALGSGPNLGDSCGYNGADPEGGVGRDQRASVLLSNGQEIFDLSGNVSEWIDWDESISGFQLAPTTCSSSELSTLNCPDLSDAEYNTSNGSYTRAQGVGFFIATPGQGGAVQNGGHWNNNTFTGVFNIGLTSVPTSTAVTTGFRCVYRP